MKKKDLEVLTSEIKEVTDHYEDVAWSDNTRLLKSDFDISSIKTPNSYLNTVNHLDEVLRETRLLFIFSVLKKVCFEDSKPCVFKVPYEQTDTYSAVVKKGEDFFLIDSDGDLREIFSNEKFMRFIDDEYWELYEE
jgi:hypothetical protein